MKWNKIYDHLFSKTTNAIIRIAEIAGTVSAIYWLFK